MNYKVRRQALGLTQQEMAVRVGVALSTYRLWEYGAPPNEENRKRLEEVLEDATIRNSRGA